MISDICPGNICPVNICPYREYLSFYWPDFDQTLKVGSLDLSWTNFNYRSNICPSNICPGNISPYQEYLRCYWPDFDQTLKVGSWDHSKQMLTITYHSDICPGIEISTTEDKSPDFDQN